MKRPLMAVVALAAVVLVATTAVAVAMSVRDDGYGHRSHAIMGTGPLSDRMLDSRSGDWMHSGRGAWMTMGDAGVREEFTYLTHMVAHHQEAVDAARQLARSERPQLRAFGRDIVATQSAQIDQMTAWLAAWYPGRSIEVEYRPMMRDLTGLSGDGLDRAFLQDMVVHHMAAIMMSHQLLQHGSADHPEVADLAQTISDEQHAEVVQMRVWLTAWYGAGWRHGWSVRLEGRTGPTMTW